MIAYQAKMLPQVDYQKIEEDFLVSLTDLEYQTMQDFCDFLEHLKTALIAEHLMQVPEWLVAHLCAYLGTALTVHTVREAETLEPFVIDLIKHQAHAAYQHFNLYPINSTVSSEQGKENIEKLRKSAPSSIIVQTMRLGRVVMDILDELREHRQRQFKAIKPPAQTEVFCPQEILIKIMLLVSAKKCANWRKALELEGLSDHYVVNQMAIQLGWLIGYFSHLDQRSPNETQYFDYGLPLIKMYQAHVFKLMETYTHGLHAQEEADSSKNSEAETLLSEIHVLSEKTHAQARGASTDFQKQILIAQAGLEKKVIELITQKYALKIILLSLFFFWFTLEAPRHADDPASIADEDPMMHMMAVIGLIKNTAKSLPNPEFTPELKVLNEKMQQLKSHLPHPEDLDKAVPENIRQQTEHINVAIHSVTSDYLSQDIHPEAVAIALFSQWLRCSVFFGVSESEWQKMDYYFSDIMKVVRNYLSAL